MLVPECGLPAIPTAGISIPQYTMSVTAVEVDVGFNKSSSSEVSDVEESVWHVTHEVYVNVDVPKICSYAGINDEIPSVRSDPSTSISIGILPRLRTVVVGLYEPVVDAGEREPYEIAEVTSSAGSENTSTPCGTVPISIEPS